MSRSVRLIVVLPERVTCICEMPFEWEERNGGRTASWSYAATPVFIAGEASGISRSST